LHKSREDGSWVPVYRSIYLKVHVYIHKKEEGRRGSSKPLPYSEKEDEK
jgi:hypothetical protein